MSVDSFLQFAALSPHGRAGFKPAARGSR